MKNKVLLYPFIVIAVGRLVATLFTPFIGEWTFLPLAVVYWLLTIVLSLKTMGCKKVKSLFQKPPVKNKWGALAILVGLIPLSILLMNLSLLKMNIVLLLWILFAFINPIFEEIFWRGLLLEELPLKKWGAILYSTFFFVISHPLMWGYFSIANRSWMTLVSLIIMGFAWSIVYIKTKSLRWCLVSHFMVDIFNLSVYVFLNLYIPPVM